ncbi:esterase-like activity of phytase family protein [Azospirillum sp. YIM B02556]|uniref:Esterase-like activity of phytase family protein n=1 Tax=Azospirillum endophyticum TaxID=2800326 RepID=A0ABS1F415_9PROT|nr:esterase-like activity of phytase family protein [Azospirillum endophyticum]MBK1838170.1 esterase-like activity of phytase family protein [Azospirillum endophyticum]
MTMRKSSDRTLLAWGLSLLALSGGCAAMVGAGGTDTESVTASAVPLDRGRPDRSVVGPLRFLGGLDIAGGDRVGGLSGLWVAPAGDRFVAVGDTGLVVDGRLRTDADGRLDGLSEVHARPLRVEEGASRRKRRTDAEDLTRLPDGGWLVSLERDHRILRYGGGDRGPEGTPTPIPLPSGMEDAPENGGLEALTLLSDGRLLAVEEGEDDGRRERRAWITRAGLAGDGVPRGVADWQPFTYLAAPRYRPTAAAPLPDGGALVLERRVSLLGGWSSRLVRVAPRQLAAGAVVAEAVVEGEELGRLEAPLVNDNFEGIATRPGPAGQTLVYLVSDNNFSSLQRTYLLLFALHGPSS